MSKTKLPRKKSDRTIAKMACSRLDKLLTAIDFERGRRSKGHSDGEKILKIAYSDAEEFLDNIGWEDM